MITTDNFEQRLIEWASGMVGRRCEWGETDCAQLALMAIDLILGTRHAGDHAGTYSDEAGALERLGGFDMDGFLTGVCGLTPVSLAFARIGDIITASNDTAPFCAHICLGARVLSGIPGDGIFLLPKRALAKTAGVTAWRAV